MNQVIDTAIESKGNIGMFESTLKLMWLEIAYNQGLTEEATRDRVLEIIFESL